MLPPLGNIDNRKAEWNKIAQLPKNRKLKYLAYFFISVGIALLIIMIIWYDNLSREALLFMRGCAGLFAIFFAIVVTIYLYRINTAFHNQRYKARKNNR